MGLKMTPQVQKLIIFSLVCFFLATWTNFLHQSLPSLHFNQQECLPDDPIRNSTLGFHEVFVLALPDRADRVVPLLNAANATNISVTILDAVRDNQISQDSWPIGWGTTHEPKNGELGCRTSHVRSWKKMVAERIGSALIMESDADWDMRIKDIMTSIAQGAKTIVDWPFNVPKNQTQNTNESPYGENWDIIWIGHCGSENNGYGRIYSWNDTTVPPEDREYTFAQPPQDEQHRPGTRFIYQFHSTVCSTGYAISLQGAVKLDEYFKEGSENLDIELMNLCSSKRDLTCLAVWPQVITAASTKSNIEHPEGEIAAYESDEVVVQPGPALQYSARVNADQVISKGLGRESWVAEWNSTWTMFNSTWTQVDFDDTEEMRNWEKVKNGTDGITKI